MASDKWPSWIANFECGFIGGSEGVVWKGGRICMLINQSIQTENGGSFDAYHLRDRVIQIFGSDMYSNEHQAIDVHIKSLEIQPNCLKSSLTIYNPMVWTKKITIDFSRPSTSLILLFKGVPFLTFGIEASIFSSGHFFWHT